MAYTPYNLLVTHGFEFDEPNVDSLDSVLLDYRVQIEKMVDQPVFIHSWYSAPFDFNLPRELIYGVYNFTKVWIRSWLNGHSNPYSWTYKQLSQDGITTFVQMIKDNYAKYNQKVVILGHSLGSKVAIEAANQVPEMIDKMILLNGAFLLKEALPIVTNFTFPVLNICDTRDAILAKLGANFSGDGINKVCIGHAGLGTNAPPLWTDIIIDSPTTIAAAAKRGWSIEGDNVKDGFLGQFTCSHWYSYRNPGNYPLVRSWLAGDSLSDLKS